MGESTAVAEIATVGDIEVVGERMGVVVRRWGRFGSDAAGASARANEGHNKGNKLKPNRQTLAMMKRVMIDINTFPGVKI